MSDIKKILIAGVGGVLGRELLKAFRAKGVSIVGLGLNEREFAGIEKDLAARFIGNVTSPSTIQGICQGVDAVVSVIGITRIKGNLTHMDVDYQGNVNLLKEAKKSGVKKFVFISPAGTDVGAKYGVPMMEAKFRFEEELKVSGIGWVIVRAGGFMRDFFQMAQLAQKGPMYIIGKGDVVSTPVEVTELAHLMAEDTLNVTNAYTSIGGPEDMTWNEICGECFRIWSKPVKIISMPVWTCNLALAIIRPFSAQYYGLGELLVFFSVTSVPTEKRGHISLRDYFQKSQSAKG